MAKYELEMTEVQAEVLAQSIGGRVGCAEVAARIREQIPKSVPTKVGAVVQTTYGVFLRWAYEAHTHEPWVQACNLDTTFRTDDIGHITKVLSEGVDY